MTSFPTNAHALPALFNPAGFGALAQCQRAAFDACVSSLLFNSSLLAEALTGLSRFASGAGGAATVPVDLGAAVTRSEAAASGPRQYGLRVNSAPAPVVRLAVARPTPPKIRKTPISSRSQTVQAPAALVAGDSAASALTPVASPVTLAAPAVETSTIAQA